jgi:hypothetical protein
MEMYELLLERVVVLTNEYLKIKQELKDLTENQKHNDSNGRIIHMKIKKKK